MEEIVVPKNNPKAPRWLLDLHEWRIQPYTEVPQEILESEGYGIVSYTWGYIAQWDKPATDKPKGVVWTVPTTSKWTLARAREVMQKIGTRYIWWDWMCVPQGLPQDLTPELLQAKGEEIGKQLHIYKRSSKSIVWLHSTSWGDISSLKEVLLLEMSRPGLQDPSTVENYTSKVENWIHIAQKEERWLKSGWTLQEGVLLSGTCLIDGDGNTLCDSRFYNGTQATVRDLSIPVSSLAFNLASGYFIQSEGHDPDTTRPGDGQFGHLLPKSPESVIWLRRALKNLVQSGLVWFFEYSPLFILAGKYQRMYSVQADSCWALIGAMGLEKIEVSYELPMEEIKKRFLSALVEKYQLMMLFLPFPEFQIEDRGSLTKRAFQWTDIVDGVLLPIGLFLVESHADENVPADKQPILQFSDEKFTSNELRLRGPNGQIMSLFRLSGDHVSYFRHYRQDSDGLRIVSSSSVDLSDDRLLADGWLLHLWNVDEKEGIRGKACILLLQVDRLGIDDQPVGATFGGMIDVWAPESEKVEVKEIVLRPSQS